MTKVSRQSLVDQTAAVLREYIAKAGFLPGDKLPSEVTLCEKFGVSRTTIREAMRVLQASDVIRLIPNRGAFMVEQRSKSLSALGTWVFDHSDEIADVLEARMIIEPEAAALAAQRATDEERFLIRGIHEEFSRAGREKDFARILNLDERFHEVIVGSCHNDLIIEVYKIVSTMVRSFRENTFQVDRDASIANATHGKIAEAIATGDAKQARCEMQRHLQDNVELVRKLNSHHMEEK